MLRLALRQARSTAGRLTLAGIAIALGTGFVAAVLLTSALFTRTVEATTAASYQGADAVVQARQGPLTDAQLAAAARAPGVASLQGRIDSGAQLVGASRTEYVDLRSTTSAPQLAAHDRGQLTRGDLPSAAGEVALSETAAERLGVGVGDQLRVRTYPSAPADGDGAAPGPSGPVDVPITVVGLLDATATGVFDTSGTLLATPADALDWTGPWGYDAQDRPLTGYGTALVVADPGADPEQVRSAVAKALGAAGADAPEVATTRQVVDRSVDDFTGGTRVLTGVALAFAAVALFVATSVITNTFSVLVAQRTRQLALLRCVGATSGQVRRSILLEAAVLGLAASTAGVLAGTGIAAVASRVLALRASGVPVPDGVALTPTSALVPLLVGVGATLLAALPPARAATRVSPLAALRPAADPDLRTPSSRVRLAVSLLLVVVGGALLAGGTAVATGLGADTVNGATGTSDELLQLGLPVAVLGGMLSFTGVLVGAVFLVPRVVAVVGRLATPAGGAPARLAALNAARNPRRTASTTSALLIGTTLVALMVVGAATTSSTLAAALDRQFPVDAEVTAVSSTGGSAPALAPAVVRAATGVSGVQASAQLFTAQLVAVAGPGASQPAGTWLDVVAAPREVLQQVVADPGAVAALQPGTAVLPLEVAGRLGVSDGDELTVLPTATTTSFDGSSTSSATGPVPGAAGAGLRVAVSQLGGQAALLTPADLVAVQPDAAQGALWLRLAPSADAVAVAGDLQSAVGAATGTDAGALPASVTGTAAERATYQQVIDTMLLVVVGLLAVAVVIALVGVANTLSLSVIERTRENAVLRALGLTRGQLRRMLALEGALVAGVGGLLGVVLGSLYGWAGAASLLGGAAAAAGDAVWTPALPWGRLALLLAVAVAAGLLASVLPARRAVRTPPVAALADR